MADDDVEAARQALIAQLLAFMDAPDVRAGAQIDALIAAVRAETTQEAIAFIKARGDMETPVVQPGMWFAAGYVREHFPR